MTDAILIDRHETVATVSFNNPASRNALSLAMYDALPKVLGELDADPAVRVIVLRGVGTTAFASGADISEFGTIRKDADSARAYNAKVADAEHALEGLRKPTIALIHGFCIGGGCGLALACDLRFADDRSRFGITPAKLGLVYSLESTRRLVDTVGPSRAKWILFSGEHLRAPEALSLGLVDEVHAPDALDERVNRFAATIAERAQYSVRTSKEIVRLIENGQVHDDDHTTELRNASFDTADYAEGVQAFIQKRPARFTWS